MPLLDLFLAARWVVASSSEGSDSRQRFEDDIRLRVVNDKGEIGPLLLTPYVITDSEYFVISPVFDIPKWHASRAY